MAGETWGAKALGVPIELRHAKGGVGLIHGSILEWGRLKGR